MKPLSLPTEIPQPLFNEQRQMNIGFFVSDIKIIWIFSPFPATHHQHHDNNYDQNEDHNGDANSNGNGC